MKILALPRYTRTGASSRLRMMQYFDFFKNNGCEIDVYPFFDDDYLEQLYSGNRKPLSIVAYYVARIKTLVEKNAYDVIWVEKEILPWLPSPVDILLLRGSAKIVVDYDDAVFHRYDMHRNSIVRKFLGNKIRGIMARADLVVAGNKYLSNYAKSSGAMNCKIVPTVVDSSAYKCRAEGSAVDQLVIGWIGSPGTWNDYMVPMLDVLSDVCRRHNAILHAVGAGSNLSNKNFIKFSSWSEDREVALIRTMDVGLMPLDSSPWSNGKCGYKLIQYMATSVPVIASPVGVNQDIVEHDINGYLASNEEDWRIYLDKLLIDQRARVRMGEAGRLKIEEDFSLQVWAPKLLQMFKELLPRTRS